MAVKKSAREQFLGMLKGECPQDIMFYTLGMKATRGTAPTRSIGPNLFDNARTKEGGTDMWGIKYVANEEAAWGSLPEPGNFMFDDVTKWADFVKAPKQPDVDWEAMAKADFEKYDFLEESASVAHIGFGPFQQLVAFMGFNDGLMALVEEPEACKEMLNYICDFYMPIIEKTLDYYKPDCAYMGDDTASRLNPFFSVETYKDIFLPIYQRMAKPANDRGIPIGFHNCGRCEDFLPFMFDFGVRYWDPAQSQNDFHKIKKDYNNQMVICGGWDVDNLDNWPNTTEEEIRQSVRDCIDDLAEGGGLVYKGRIMAAPGDTHTAQVNEWIKDEALTYGENYYEKH